MTTYAIELSPDKETGLFLRGKQHALIAGIKTGSQMDAMDVRIGDEIIQVADRPVTSIINSSSSKTGTETAAALVAEAISHERGRAVETNTPLVLHFLRSSSSSTTNNPSSSHPTSIVNQSSWHPLPITDNVLPPVTRVPSVEMNQEFVPLPLKTTLSTDHFPPITIQPAPTTTTTTTTTTMEQATDNTNNSFRNNSVRLNVPVVDNLTVAPIHNASVPSSSSSSSASSTTNPIIPSTTVDVIDPTTITTTGGIDQFPVLRISYPSGGGKLSSSSSSSSTFVSSPVLSPITSGKNRHEENSNPNQRTTGSTSAVTFSNFPSKVESHPSFFVPSSGTVSNAPDTKLTANEVLKETNNLRLKIKMQQLLELFHLYDTKIEQYRQWENQGQPLSTSVLFSNQEERMDMDALQNLRDDTLMELNIIRGQLNLEPYAPLPSSVHMLLSSLPSLSQTVSNASNTVPVYVSPKFFGNHASIPNPNDDEYYNYNQPRVTYTKVPMMVDNKDDDWVVIDQRAMMESPTGNNTRTVYPVSPPVAEYSTRNSGQYISTAIPAPQYSELRTMDERTLPYGDDSFVTSTVPPSNVAINFKPNTLPTELLEYEASLRYYEERLRIDQDRLQRREAALGAIASRLSERQSQAAKVLATATAMAEAAKNEVTLMNETRRSTMELSDSLQTRTSPVRNYNDNNQDDENINRYDTETVPGITLHVELDTLSPRLPVPVAHLATTVNTSHESVPKNSNNNGYPNNNPPSALTSANNLPVTRYMFRPVPTDHSTTTTLKTTNSNNSHSNNGVDSRVASYLNTSNNWSRHQLVNHTNTIIDNPSKSLPTDRNNENSTGTKNNASHSSVPIVMPFHQEVPERAKLWEGFAYGYVNSNNGNMSNPTVLSSHTNNNNNNGNGSSNGSTMTVNFHSPHTYPLPFVHNNKNNHQNTVPTTYGSSNRQYSAPSSNIPTVVQSQYPFEYNNNTYLPSSPVHNYHPSSHPFIVPRLSPSLPNRSEYNRFLAPATIASQQSARVVARINTNSNTNRHPPGGMPLPTISSTSPPPPPPFNHNGPTMMSPLPPPTTPSAHFAPVGGNNVSSYGTSYNTNYNNNNNNPTSNGMVFSGGNTNYSMNIRSVNAAPVGYTKSHQDKPSRPHPKMDEGIFPGE